jgi:phage-related protein
VPLGKFFGDVWKAIVILAQGAWNRLVTLFQTALAVIIGAWRLVWGTVSAFAQMIWNQILERIRGPLNTAKNNISSVLNTIKGIWNVAWTAVSSVVRERLNTAKTIVSGAITAIKNFFAGAGRWLYDAGRNIIRGLIDGIEDMLGGLADTLSGVTEWIKEHKGPKERDLRLLRPAGHFLMQGLMRGIADMVPDLSRQLGDISMMMAIQGPTLPSQVNQAPVGVVPQGEQPASTIINQDITVNTQEIDPVRHSTEIGWLLAMRR